MGKSVIRKKFRQSSHVFGNPLNSRPHFRFYLWKKHLRKNFYCNHLYYLDVKNWGIIHTPSTFFIPSGWPEEARQGKKGHVKQPKKIGQNLGFVPLITTRNLAGRQKKVKTTL
jgi:hypothetical protein